MKKLIMTVGLVVAVIALSTAFRADAQVPPEEAKLRLELAELQSRLEKAEAESAEKTKIIASLTERLDALTKRVEALEISLGIDVPGEPVEQLPADEEGKPIVRRLDLLLNRMPDESKPKRGETFSDLTKQLANAWLTKELVGMPTTLTAKVGQKFKLAYNKQTIYGIVRDQEFIWNGAKYYLIVETSFDTEHARRLDAKSVGDGIAIAGDITSISITTSKTYTAGKVDERQGFRVRMSNCRVIK